MENEQFEKARLLTYRLSGLNYSIERLESIIKNEKPPIPFDIGGPQDIYEDVNQTLTVASKDVAVYLLNLLNERKRFVGMTFSRL